MIDKCFTLRKSVLKYKTFYDNDIVAGAPPGVDESIPS